MASNKSTEDRLTQLLDKVSSIDLSTGGGFWRPPKGRSTIRILPPVGSMDFFFVEAGTHYIDGTTHFCPRIISEGNQPCPMCEANELLYQGGEKELAAKFRVRQVFWMNIIDRKNEDSGPIIFTPGKSIFATVVSYIQDPEYGDPSDEVEGYDIKIDRSGDGLETEYQVKAARVDSPLSDDDELMEEWVENAVDLRGRLDGLVKSYDELAEASGAIVYLDDDYEAPDDEDDEIPWEDDDEEDETPSAKISRRLKSRKSKVGRGRARRRR